MDRKETSEWLLRSGKDGFYELEDYQEEQAMESKREKPGWVTVFMFANIETNDMQCFILPGMFNKEKVFKIGWKTIHPMGLSALALHVAMKTLTTQIYHMDEIAMDNPLTV